MLIETYSTLADAEELRKNLPDFLSIGELYKTTRLHGLVPPS